MSQEDTVSLLDEDTRSSFSSNDDEKRMCEVTKIKFKRLLKDVKLPQKMTPLSAGLDIFYPHQQTLCIPPGATTGAIDLGFAIKLEDHTYAQLVSRSGLACKKGIEVVGQPATIDADYVGPLRVYLRNNSNYPHNINFGQRFLQMVLGKRFDVEFEECKELPETSRGSGGFGSTGEGFFLSYKICSCIYNVSVFFYYLCYP